MRLWMKIFVNLLTTLRLVITFLFMLFFRKMSSVYFLVSVTFIFLTDFLDGKLARRFRVQTFYGSHMDTIADKVFSIGLMFMIIDSVSLVWFPLLGEILIAIINLVGIIGHKKTKSSMLGKIKTWLVAIGIILAYLYYYYDISVVYVWIGCISTFIVQCVVMVQYIRYLSCQKVEKVIKNGTKEKGLFYYLFDTEYFLSHS